MLQLDFASTQCMNALIDNMVGTAQLRAEDRPDQKGFRQQFHHVIDIMPTILEAANIPAPASINGVA